MSSHSTECSRALSIETIPEILSRRPEPFRIFDQIKPQVIDQITTRFESIIKTVQSNHKSEANFLGKEFDELLDAVIKAGESSGISYHKKEDLIGVFPEGLTKIGLSGFGKVDSQNLVNFAARHEMAHLIHVTYVRMILLEAQKQNASIEFSKSIDQFLEWFEGNSNYLEFEKAVTQISGALHTLRPKPVVKSTYYSDLKQLIADLKSNLDKSTLAFKTRANPYGVYAWVVSRAPLVLGQSLGQLVLRLSVPVFIIRFSMDRRLQDLIFGLFGTPY